MAFSPVDIEHVKDSVDIVATIQRYVDLQRSGSSYKGLCPFHTEKHPSFHVYQATGTFKCYGCGAGGDVISFMERHLNLTFLEVVQQLAEESGIELKVYAESDGASQRKKMLFEILERTQEFFQESFNGSGGKSARDYLEKRKIGASDLQLGIGYAPGGNALLRYLEGRGFSVSVMEEAGIVLAGKGNHYDRFRNRLTFPIRDRRDRVVSFGARALDGAEPKYLNGPETPVYTKGSFLYGYSRAQKQARDRGRVVLVEGYFDHARLLSAGYEEVVATSGTALTEKQARNLIGMADNIFICYDGDSAGSKASVKAAEMILGYGGYPMVIKLPAGCDPDDLILQQGINQFEKLLSSAMDPVSFCVSLLSGKPAAGPERTRIAHRLLQVASSASDPLVEEELIKKVETFTGYSRTTLLKAADNDQPVERRKKPRNDNELSGGDRAILRAVTAGGRLDRDLIRFLRDDDMSSISGTTVLGELRVLVDKGYSSVVFGELSDEVAGFCADISGFLSSVTGEDVEKLKSAVEKSRREKPRRRELREKLHEANAEERALILEDLNDGGGLHEH